MSIRFARKKENSTNAFLLSESFLNRRKSEKRTPFLTFNPSLPSFINGLLVAVFYFCMVLPCWSATITWLNPTADGIYEVDSAIGSHNIEVLVTTHSGDVVNSATTLSNAGWQWDNDVLWENKDSGSAVRLNVTVSGLPAGIHKVYLRYFEATRIDGDTWWYFPTIYSGTLVAPAPGTFTVPGVAERRVFTGTGGPDLDNVYDALIGTAGTEQDLETEFDMGFGKYRKTKIVRYGSIRIESEYEEPTPVLWYEFDEGSGSTVEDSSGNDYDGTITGASWIDGIFDDALDFEGEDYVTVPVASCASLDEEITVALWVYGDPNFQPQADFCFEARDSSGRIFGVHLPYSSGHVYWDTVNTTERIYKLATSSEYEGQWNHWAFTKNSDTGEMNIYLNGQLWHTGSGFTTPLGSVTSFRIGAHANLSGYSYDGLIDEFRLYDRELSAATIFAIYNYPY